MIASEEVETVLLFLPRESHPNVFPLSSLALRRNPGVPEQRLNAENVGGLIVYRSGIERTIETIKYLDTSSERISSQIARWWKQNFPIDVALSDPKNVEMARFKSRVSSFLARELDDPEPLIRPGQPKQQVLNALDRAGSVAEIFDLLNIPPPEECLDSL